MTEFKKGLGMPLTSNLNNTEHAIDGKPKNKNTKPR
jgi:hypothetical protein